jgi:hypothetical protein
VEAVAAVMAIRRGIVRALNVTSLLRAAVLTAALCAPLNQLHPNPNLIMPDPAVDLSVLVGATALKHEARGPPLTARAALRSADCAAAG